MTARITAKNVGKSYAGCLALRDASLDLYEGEILTLVGPNGSGKTTLIKILATLLVKDAGQVITMGYDLDRHEAEIRRLIGYVGQDTDRSAYARLTARENLEFFGALRGLSRREIAERIEELVGHFEFEDNLDKQFMSLSGGQKQTAIIMRALLSDPPIAYLDEPTRGLDPFVARRIRRFLRRYVIQQRKSVLLTSHILSEVEELADRVALIHKGTIPVTGTPVDLKRSLSVEGFLELRKDHLSADIEAEIVRSGAIQTHEEREPGWVSFGVSGGLVALEMVLQTLRTHGCRTEFRYRPVGLEDAFFHHIGILDEKFEL